MKTPARKALMVDRYLATAKKDANPILEWKFEERVRSWLHEAKRFAFDNEAARYAAEVVKTYPDVIARNQEFAIPPFSCMYVEMPFREYFEILTGRAPDPTADINVGYLIRGPQAFVISETSEPGQVTTPLLMPLQYMLNKPWTMQEELHAAEMFQGSRMHLDAFFWGESYDKLEPDDVRALRANHSMQMLPIRSDASHIPETAIWQRVYHGSAGDLRNIIATILLLNRTSDIRYEDRMLPVRGWIKSKPRTFLAHSVVKFTLNPVPRIKKLQGVSGSWRREHGVRGHFCHNEAGRSKQHEHVWLEYGVNKWRCMTIGCGGLKWWKKEHKRGSKEKGRVKTTYEVTQ